MTLRMYVIISMNDSILEPASDKYMTLYLGIFIMQDTTLQPVSLLEWQLYDS